MQSQTASFITLAEAIYSASTEKVVIVGCIFEDQEIEPLEISKMNPPTE